MTLRSHQNAHQMRVGIVALLLSTIALASWAMPIRVIGKVESLYRDRASIRILEVPNAASAPAQLAVGNYVSFNLPSAKQQSRPKRPIQYGNVILVDLAGNIATEYADETAVATDSQVMIWNALYAERVKNPKQYLSEEEGGTKGKKGKGKKKREKEQPQIWTQEESVRAKVVLKKNRVYLKEDHLRPRDLGLDIIDPAWCEKLTQLQNQRVVVYGTTHRVSAASGTMEIKNVIKVYPK
ncbi:MAG: hypothetical protein BWY66_01482 [bacterium ADurb.Bin374]|nr:MAG: hypothetical protein BWY66_01482 [bacterium ADurb.Bin374]